MKHLDSLVFQVGFGLGLDGTTGLVNMTGHWCPSVRPSLTLGVLVLYPNG